MFEKALFSQASVGHKSEIQIKRPTSDEMGLFIWEPGSVLLSHGIPRTIIGAEAFHGPVRDGKAWDHLAMAARQSLNSLCLQQLEEVFGFAIASLS